MDTGSTGIVIDAIYGFKKAELPIKCQIGHLFYTSSNWLQEGHWCTTDIGIETVVTSALALIRTKEWKENSKRDMEADGETRMATRASIGAAYMGIGFARGYQPSYNLPMNVESINSVPVSPTYR
ncbi:hypothetical protein TWF694_009658 [Orbilia ellipsospora]|uniref:Uncharacterized protein n=1 Tax=Orbilia ellipsospora TaxID=2528407 RepID=A0AAV9XHW7_9PEZI